MNLMGTGMWGIGFSIVTARSRGLLKRLVATPMRKRHYLLGQMLGRMVFLIPEVAVLVGFAHLAFGVPLNGSLVALALIAALGAMSFTGIGLLVAARPRTIEGVSGLMNFVMLPMWIFSGVFFSPSRFPDAILPVIRLLPLTALNDALRAVMIDGAHARVGRARAGHSRRVGVAAFAVALAPVPLEVACRGPGSVRDVPFRSPAWRRSEARPTRCARGRRPILRFEKYPRLPVHACAGYDPGIARIADPSHEERPW